MLSARTDPPTDRPPPKRTAATIHPPNHRQAGQGRRDGTRHRRAREGEPTPQTRDTRADEADGNATDPTTQQGAHARKEAPAQTRPRSHDAAGHPHTHEKIRQPRQRPPHNQPGQASHTGEGIWGQPRGRTRTPTRRTRGPRKATPNRRGKKPRATGHTPRTTQGGTPDGDPKGAARTRERQRPSLQNPAKAPEERASAAPDLGSGRHPPRNSPSHEETGRNWTTGSGGVPGREKRRRASTTGRTAFPASRGMDTTAGSAEERRRGTGAQLEVQR